MEFSNFAVPSSYALIFFLGYPTQWLLVNLEPRPLSNNELVAANVVLGLILITYTRSVFVDPGTIKRDWADGEELGQRFRIEKGKGTQAEKEAAKSRKWCRKCDAAKPPRAHHCKECKRCIPKMDHHCPWTANCVSHTTFPHFLRFLFFATIGLSFLEVLLFTRLAHLWTNRNLPAYLGPSPFQLAHLFIILIANSITLFGVGILCIRNIWCLAVNTTTIEGWEIERHRTLLRRARHFGGYLDAADGTKVRIKKQEFPYDIGIWANIVQGMGTANPLAWVNPFAGTPSVSSGLRFETNGFEDEGTTWPPPDPDRTYRKQPKAVNASAFTYHDSKLSREDTLAAFRARQEEDVVRRRAAFEERVQAVKKRDFGREEEDEEEYQYGDEASDVEDEGDNNKKKDSDGKQEGEEGWRNSEGERLKDFGVDEDVEFYDEQEDEIPLRELLARRQAASATTSSYSYS